MQGLVIASFRGTYKGSVEFEEFGRALISVQGLIPHGTWGFIGLVVEGSGAGRIGWFSFGFGFRAQCVFGCRVLLSLGWGVSVRGLR